MYSKLKLQNINEKIKDSLIELTLVNQKRIEEANFKHFQDIKNICTKSQLEDFNILTEELEKLYGNRVRSRLRSMFNLISFPQSASDKRK